MPGKTTTIVRKNARSSKSHGPNGSSHTTPTIQPWIRVENVEEACAFYQKLGFQQTMALPNSDGTWAWAVLRIGNGGIQLSPIDQPQTSNEVREKQIRNGPRGLGCSFYVTVPNVDKLYEVCTANGLEITAEPRNEFWGDRVFSCVDAYGYEWTFATTYKQMTPEDIVNSAQNH